MKRTVTIFLLLITLNQTSFSSNNEEFRATWVITWELINSSYSAEANKALARTILDNHQKANMNAVLWQCRQSGTAYYQSSYEPWGSYAGSKDPGYDPLAYAVEEAHKRGLELHAWFNVFHTSSTQPGTPAAEHPEWVCRDRDGNPMTSSRALSPGLAAVREYTIKVIMEIVRNYDIDGLHLDYVRWNEYSSTNEPRGFAKNAEEERQLDGMITEEQIRDLNENMAGRYLYDVEHPYSAGVPTGFSSWEEWWRWSVTEFVRTLHDSIQAVKPWVRLSAAALGRYNWESWNGYYSVYQDAALWFNEGYIDQLTPMHYHWLSGPEFYHMLARGDSSSWQPWIQKGIDDSRLFSTGPGSYKLASSNLWGNHPQIVEAVRTVPWVDGFQFFSNGDWADYQYWDEAGETFFKGKTKIRDTKLIVSSSPDAPTIELTKLDSLKYQITVIPPTSVTTDHRYAIYRSTDNNFDLDNDDIVDIHFSKDSYAYTDVFTGLQDYNGSYFYAATVFDRYWNESVISNTASSDSIPSFAPTVIATTPQEGDTIAVTNSIIVYFSKKMDATSFQNAITFSPDVTIDQLTWSDAKNSLTIRPAANLQYGTDYTLTIGASAKDINGKPIDGNGDGVYGDAFYLHFRTKEVAGPVVIYTYPDYQVAVDSFDVDEVITFLFDENIDPKTVYDSTVVLSLNNEVIKTQALISTAADKSLISLKSYDALQSDKKYDVLLRNTITDTLGNLMSSDFAFDFRTSNEFYTERTILDNFSLVGYWEQPSYSGSTTGIVVANTSFGYSKDIYLPGSATAPVHKRSAYIQYQWMETPPPDGYLLREYLKSGPPRDVLFDNSYILQCYVYGDASYNKFRFCLREVNGQGYPLEVSKWVTINWYGWKLLEWNLSDPNSVGTWLGNEIMDGTSYYVDSFQLTHDNLGSLKGKIYLDNLRIVKKSTGDVGIADKNQTTATTFKLYQNYPNPFNPTTRIPFDLSKKDHVELKVYDILGRHVATLIDWTMAPGHYEVLFDGTHLASGIYICRLDANGQIQIRQMTLLK